MHERRPHHPSHPATLGGVFVRVFGIVSAIVFVAVVTPGCWHLWSAPEEGECHEGVRYFSGDYLGAPTTLTVEDPAQLDVTKDCTERYPLAGFAPCDGGKHPLVVFVPGTAQPYQHRWAMELLANIAGRGFVAASLDYGNVWPIQGCNRYRPRAECMFDSRGSQSAVSALCARADTDCDRGIAVLGHSQGGVISLLAANFEPRVAWVHAIGISANAPPTADDFSCVLPPERRLPASRMLVACGECDDFFAGTNQAGCVQRSVGVSAGLIRLTGVDCGSPWGCTSRRTDTGARVGWMKIPNFRMRDGVADHCYPYTNGCLGPPDPEWNEDRSIPWGEQALLDNLVRTLKRR